MFIFKRSPAPNKFLKIFHGGPGSWKSPRFWSVKEWEPCISNAARKRLVLALTVWENKLIYLLTIHTFIIAVMKVVVRSSVGSVTNRLCKHDVH